MSRRFHTIGYFKIDFAAYVDDIFFHKLVSESYKPEKGFFRRFTYQILTIPFLSFFFIFFFTVYICDKPLKGVKALFSRDKVL